MEKQLPATYMDGRYRVYGILVKDEERFLQMGLKLGIVDDCRLNHYNCIFEGVLRFLALNGVKRALPMMVQCGDHRRVCIAIASQNPKDYLPTPRNMPSQESIDHLKKTLNTERQPRWFVHV